MYRFLTVFLVFIAAGNIVQGNDKFIPDAPVLNFRIPVFGDEGYRRWYIQGDKGIYVDESTLHVEGLGILMFAPPPLSTAELVIESPFATIHPHDQVAFSPGPLAVSGGQFELTGKNWRWIGPEKKMIVNEDVKVIFNDLLTELKK